MCPQTVLQTIMTAIDKFKLDGKIVVVTGRARGIGYAVAELSASVGADVARRLAASSSRKVNFYQADLYRWPN